MPTTLTTPVTVSALLAGIDSIQIDLQRNADGTVAMDTSSFSVDLVYRKSDGSVLRRDVVQMSLSELPTSIKTPGRALFAAVTTALRSSGKLGAGTDTQDF